MTVEVLGRYDFTAISGILYIALPCEQSPGGLELVDAVRFDSEDMADAVAKALAGLRTS